MDFIEQNKHLLWNWDSWECIPMKIKGKWIFITLFLTFVDSTTCRVSVWLVLVAERCTQIIAWCAFAGKAFLKSDTAVALRRSLSLSSVSIYEFTTVGETQGSSHRLAAKKPPFTGCLWVYFTLLWIIIVRLAWMSCVLLMQINCFILNISVEQIGP
jgi:hypothetical protein